MIEIDMGVACGVDEFSGLESAHLRHHHAEKGVGGDVEGDTKKTVGRTLIELKGELPIRYVKLEEGMARRQVHILYIRHIPCADNYASGVGIVFNGFYGLRNLVDESTIIVGP